MGTRSLTKVISKWDHDGTPKRETITCTVNMMVIWKDTDMT